MSAAPTALAAMSSAFTEFDPDRAMALPVPRTANSAMNEITVAGDGSLLSLLSITDIPPCR
jgi:hypothetical protein